MTETRKVFVSTTGAYYVATEAKDPSDSQLPHTLDLSSPVIRNYIPIPDPQLEALWDTVADAKAENKASSSSSSTSSESTVLPAASSSRSPSTSRGVEYPDSSLGASLEAKKKEEDEEMKAKKEEEGKEKKANEEAEAKLEAMKSSGASSTSGASSSSASSHSTKR